MNTVDTNGMRRFPEVRRRAFCSPQQREENIVKKPAHLEFSIKFSKVVRSPPIRIRPAWWTTDFTPFHCGRRPVLSSGPVTVGNDADEPRHRCQLMTGPLPRHGSPHPTRRVEAIVNHADQVRIEYSADASTLRDAAECSARPRFCGGTTTWPGPRVQPPQPEIASMAAPTNIDTKVYTDQPVSSASPPTRDKINGEEKARSRRRDTWPEPATASSTDEVNVVRSPLLQQQHQQYDEQLRDIAASLTRPRSRRALPPTLERPTRLPPPDRLPARGAPDGGPPPEEGITSSASEGSEPNDAAEATESTEGGRVELPAERLLHARAGWLQRRSPSGWSRHWFVLRGAALLYFRDPHAEHRGLMDGVIDLSGISRVIEMPGSTNGYAFETETWDGKHIVLSAVTAGIRANWVSAMRRTAGLPDTGPLSLILREDSVDKVSESSTSPITPVTPNTTKSGPFSSDDEYRTASEGGRRDSADWGDVTNQPPPSPILNRTPISRVKEKVRARACLQPQTKPDLKVEKDEIDSTKEKENLPLDEVDENEKPNEPRKRSYISTIDKQTIEIEDLRKQLKLALNDVNSAESELARLRKLKSEAATREKKMEDLVITLQKKEEELTVRTKEAENLDAIKQLYNQDKNMWETKLTETQNFLKESTEHCELLTRQLTTAQEAIKQLQKELNELNEKVLRSVRENESLYSRIRELESKVVAESPTREKRKSIGSLNFAQGAAVGDAHGDGLRARYQQEIEQLRALCEKGLLAMESSHRRIVREMEDKHRAERDQLRLEKEQALAEETRATLAALDAMRKAHENEVRREVDKFKTEFLARGAPELGQLSSRHQQEMEEIKREILSLSEKYSVKCVESAALEERLAAASAQLAHAHNHIMQLDARNKQLRAHIMSEANEMKYSEASTLAQFIEDSPPGKSSRSSPLERSRAPPSPFASPETTRSLQMSPVQN
ncbi:jg18873 [Pararge aegeria aegeria]|uniref:Jg18873 protein n=1 Tax=Pararge aegeria aegeria TaxID=348720 RepID=A0A8S4RSL1_9NEOP|nr:jg18873 [Pararge aegeria aegeria]